VNRVTEMREAPYASNSPTGSTSSDFSTLRSSTRCLSTIGTARLPACRPAPAPARTRSAPRTASGTAPACAAPASPRARPWPARRGRCRPTASGAAAISSETWVPAGSVLVRGLHGGRCGAAVDRMQRGAHPAPMALRP
jgi:hypothetical protein